MTGREAAFASVYFGAYLGSLFASLESELLHWVTLVALPVLGLWTFGRHASWRHFLDSLGLRPPSVTRGLGTALVLALAFQVLQLLNARQRADVAAALAGPLGPLLPLFGVLLLLGTAATTEEVFFRGVLQTRFADWCRSELAGGLISIAAFVLYHLPYAYLNPAWASAGDFPAAVRASVANGTITGAALAFTFWRGRRNLAAAILLHALIDLLPAIRLAHRLLA